MSIPDKDIETAVKSGHTINYVYHDVWLADRKAARELVAAIESDTIDPGRMLKALEALKERIKSWDGA